jgi:NCAIR mutase (PurE)-related protein
MDPEKLTELLESFKAGQITLEATVERLRQLPFEVMEFATIDHHRTLRCGFPEVIYCPGKTVEQTVSIFGRLAEHGGNVLATRASDEQVAAVQKRFPAAKHHALARAITLRQRPAPAPEPVPGAIGILSAGTSDLPVAEEARVTAEIMDQPTITVYDVGVAGLHRLLGRLADLQRAKVLVVVAGMEGALASVVGGLVSCPVIAVPTSVGYGASFNGLAPLLTMLNSCAANVAVVNIDNGFAAGYIASLINRQST